MKNNKTIYFVSTNKDKAFGYKRRLAKVGWELIQIDLELPEDRALECRDVARGKLKFAMKKIKERPVFVEDRGLELEALNGFPKSHIKDLTQVIKLETIYPLVKERPGAKFRYAVALCNGEGEAKIFEGEEAGFIRPTRGNNPGLKDVFCYYLYPETPLSKLTKNQQLKYQKSWTKNDAVAGLIAYLTKSK